MKEELNIKQIIPVGPEITSLITVHKGDDEYYKDAASCGSTVVFALIKFPEGDSIMTITIDSSGVGQLDDTEVRLVPTVHCRNCGQRMGAIAEDDVAPVTYSCVCGSKYCKQNGWTQE